jgi:hypothetical protein
MKIIHVNLTMFPFLWPTYWLHLPLITSTKVSMFSDIRIFRKPILILRSKLIFFLCVYMLAILVAISLQEILKLFFNLRKHNGRMCQFTPSKHSSLLTHRWSKNNWSSVQNQDYSAHKDREDHSTTWKIPFIRIQGETIWDLANANRKQYSYQVLTLLRINSTVVLHLLHLIVFLFSLLSIFHNIYVYCTDIHLFPVV